MSTFPPGLFDLDVETPHPTMRPVSPDQFDLVAVAPTTKRPVSPYINFKNNPVKKKDIEEMMEREGTEVNRGTYSKRCRAVWVAMTAEEKVQYITDVSVAPEEPKVEKKRVPLCQDTLRPLVQHLASLRLTAYFRKQNRMMRQVARASREVYREMGWGWGEKVYQEALKMELDGLGYRVTSEIPHTIHYKGRPLGDGVNVRSDILVETRDAEPRQLLLELKAVATSASAMRKAVQQCSRYLYLKKYERGMVINFPERDGDRVWAAAV